MSKYYPLVLIPTENDISVEIEKPISPTLEKSFFGLFSFKSDKEQYQQELKEHSKKYNKHQYQTMLKGTDEFSKFSIQKEFLNKYKSVPNLESYRNFDDIKKGLTEDFFLKELKKTFGNKIYTGLVIEEFFKSKAYVPDFVFIDQSKNIYIDIEIDEPYHIGNDSKPIHFIGSDDKRDEYFLSNGWIVLRFTEEQIVKYPNRCQKEITRIIFQLTDDYSYLWIFSNIKDLKPVKQWDNDEAQIMCENEYRKTYLHLLNSEEFCEDDSGEVSNLGLIKRKIIWEQDFELDGKLKSKQIIKLIEYDMNNNIVLEINYSYSNFIDNKIIMKYNSNGKIIEKIKLENRNKYRENNLEVKYVATYFYDEKNQLIEEREKKDYTTDIYKYKYDNDGNLIEKTHGSEVRIYIKEFRTYKDGKLNEIKDYENDNLRYITTHKYDTRGNLIKLLKVDAKNKIHAKEENEYNADGDFTKADHFDIRYSHTILTMAYFSKGKPSEQKFYYSGYLNSSSLTNYVYSKEGTLIEENSFDVERKINHKKKYENGLEVESIRFNKEGNMLSKTIYEYENWN